MMLFLELFLTFFKIGLFSFGGGYAMLALIQNEVVVNHDWVNVSQFTDIVAVSQITPGPIAINAATYIGYQTAQSFWGAVCATVGVSLPSVLVTVFLYVFITKFKESPVIKNAFAGLRPTVVGLILSAALMLMNGENFIDYKSFVIFVIAFVLKYFFKVGPILMITVSAIAGIILYA